MHISMLLFLDSTRVAFVLFFLNKNYSLMIVLKRKKKRYKLDTDVNGSGF